MRAGQGGSPWKLALALTVSCGFAATLLSAPCPPPPPPPPVAPGAAGDGGPPSAETLVGAHLEGRSKALLTRLSASRSLWERRIAVIATFRFVKGGEFSETFRIVRRLLRDDHDLIHKACGWMLREAGKRGGETELLSFLHTCGDRMPRTMLRYAIERFPEAERKRFLAMGSRRRSAG